MTSGLAAGFLQGVSVACGIVAEHARGAAKNCGASFAKTLPFRSVNAITSVIAIFCSSLRGSCLEVGLTWELVREGVLVEHLLRMRLCGRG